MKTLVRKMGSLKLLKVELILGIVEKRHFLPCFI